MDFAVALPSPAYLSEDRSLGTEAEELRNLLYGAVALATHERAIETLARLLRGLRHAEDSHGIAVSFIAFDKTLRFLAALPAELPLPLVVVESEEEIELGWDGRPPKSCKPCD